MKRMFFCFFLSIFILLLDTNTEVVEAKTMANRGSDCLRQFQSTFINSIDDQDGFQEVLRNALNGYSKMFLSNQDLNQIRSGNFNTLIKPLTNALEFVYSIIYQHFEVNGFYEPLTVIYDCVPYNNNHALNNNPANSKFASVSKFITGLFLPKVAEAQCSCCSSSCGCGCQGSSGDDFGFDLTAGPEDNGSGGYYLGGDIYLKPDMDNLLARLGSNGDRSGFTGLLQKLPSPPTIFNGTISFEYDLFHHTGWAITLTWRK